VAIMIKDNKVSLDLEIQKRYNLQIIHLTQQNIKLVELIDLVREQVIELSKEVIRLKNNGL
jgi:hypothetical protein